MKYKVLLTTTSFIDTPGNHQKLLDLQNFDIVKIRGPLTENQLLDIIDNFDAMICGDDDITRKVLKKGKEIGNLKIISKYGVGLDKIDIEAAKEFNIEIRNCPGINHETVAEHIFALLLTFVKNIIKEDKYLHNNEWVRLIGTELNNKILGVIGTGNIGKEVIKRASAFGMNILAYDKFQNNDFALKYNVKYCNNLNELINNSDIITLNLNLNKETKNIINHNTIHDLKKGVILINAARAELVEQDAILKGLDDGIIGGYLTDVLIEEPMIFNHPFLNYNNVIITPHIGSRTFENVEKQGTMAVNNLLDFINKN
jgi:D-3-phosphoglycerate dehydrogenase